MQVSLRHLNLLGWLLLLHFTLLPGLVIRKDVVITFIILVILLREVPSNERPADGQVAGVAGVVALHTRTVRQVVQLLVIAACNALSPIPNVFVYVEVCVASKTLLLTESTPLIPFDLHILAPVNFGRLGGLGEGDDDFRLASLGLGGWYGNLGAFGWLGNLQSVRRVGSLWAGSRSGLLQIYNNFFEKQSDMVQGGENTGHIPLVEGCLPDPCIASGGATSSAMGVRTGGW